MADGNAFIKYDSTCIKNSKKESFFDHLKRCFILFLPIFYVQFYSLEMHKC